MVLPSPMSSARHAPRPSLVEQIKPAHAHLLVGPQRALQRIAGIDLRQTLRTAQTLSRSPRARDRLPLEPSRRLAAAGIARQRHRRRPAAAWLRQSPDRSRAPRRSTSRKRSIMLAAAPDRARSSARAPARVHPIWPAVRLISAAVSVSPSSVTSMWKSSRASWPIPEGGLPPTVPVTRGRGGRLPRHAAGIRTTTPAVFELRDVSQKLQGLVAASTATDGRSHLRRPWPSATGQVFRRSLHRNQQ